MPLLGRIGSAAARGFGFLGRVVAGIISPDAYAKYVTLLLKGDGSNGTNNNTFLDSSTNNHTITRTGTGTQGSFGPYSSFYSPYFAGGTTQYMLTNASSDFTMGTGDFTFEFWWFQTATNTGVGILSTISAGGALGVQFCGEGVYVGGNTGGSYDSFLYTTPLNQWNHMALVRISGVCYAYVNGVLAASGACTRNLTNTQMVLGTSYVNNFTFPSTGYVSCVRVVKGLGVYTGNFTVPTSPLTLTQNASTNIAAISTVTQTGFLSCLLGYWADLSVGAGSALPGAGVVITTGAGSIPFSRFSPFGKTYSVNRGYSISFNGSNNRLLGPASSGPYIDIPGAWTLEGWFYLNAVPATGFGSGVYSILTTAAAAATVNWRRWAFTGSNQITWYARDASATPAITFSQSTPIKTWFHFALVMNATTTATAYINGVQVGTATDSTTYGAGPGTHNIVVGAGTSLTNDFGFFNGYISNLRFSNTAVYTTAFTPSNTGLTSTTNTRLLIGKSSMLYDESANALVFTNPATAALSLHNPLGTYTSGAYDPTVHGSSVYLNGSTDWLNTPATGQFTTTGDFTVEFWIYPTSLAPANQEIFGNYTVNDTSSWETELQSTGRFVFYTNGGTAAISSATGAIKVNTWHHICMARSGTTVTGYINGVSQGTSTLSGTFAIATRSIFVGSQNGVLPFNGYIADARIVNTCIYKGTFGPPTAPLSTITGTGLHLKFANAGIYDNSGVNDLQTAGSAQISTSTLKYGTGSLSFNGTSDYLLRKYNDLGTTFAGDFTVEAWVYPTATRVQCVVDTRTADASSTGFFFGLNASNQAMLYHNAAATQGGTVSLNTWTHIALVRSGSTWTVYVNGVSVGTLTRAVVLNDTNLQIGASTTVTSSSTNYFSGNIDDLRITKGYARYTTTFTPPTALSTT